jgi:hypothetical protein
MLCGILIYFIMSTLKRDSNKFSAATLRMHRLEQFSFKLINYRQLTILLIVQITSPAFFIILPIAIAIIAGVLFHIYFDIWLSEGIFILLDLYAVSNSIFTL